MGHLWAAYGPLLFVTFKRIDIYPEHAVNYEILSGFHLYFHICIFKRWPNNSLFAGCLLTTTHRLIITAEQILT